MAKIAQAYLEDLQARHAALSNRREASPDILAETLSAYVPDDLHQEVERRLAKELEAQADRVPTQFQDPGGHGLMSDLLGEVNKAAADVGILRRVTEEEPVLGTLATGSVNAMAIRPPGSSTHLIVFMEGLFVFCHLMGKGVASALPLAEASGEIPDAHLFRVSPDLVREHLRNDPVPTERVVLTVLSYTIFGHPGGIARYLISKERSGLADLFRDAAELFIFAHEWAHVHLGHLGRSSAEEVELPVGPVPRVRPSHAYEFQADVTASLITLQALLNRGFGPALASASIRAVFDWMGLLDRAVRGVRFGRNPPESASDTHPPFWSRKHAVTQQLWKTLGASMGASHQEAFRDLSENLDLMFAEYWNATAYAAEGFHAAGDRPHPIWGPEASA